MGVVFFGGVFILLFALWVTVNMFGLLWCFGDGLCSFCTKGGTRRRARVPAIRVNGELREQTFLSH